MLAFVLADFVDRDDVWMLQAGHRLRLGLKTLHELVARKLPEQQHLHRDDAVQAHLPCPINDAHPAARDFLQQFVIAKLATAFTFGSRRLGFNLGSRRGSQANPHADETTWTQPLRRVGGKLRPTFLACAFCGHDRLVGVLSPFRPKSIGK